MMDYFRVIKIKTVNGINDWSITISDKEQDTAKKNLPVCGENSKCIEKKKYWKDYTIMIIVVMNMGDFFLLSISQAFGNVVIEI